MTKLGRPSQGQLWAAMNAGAHDLHRGQGRWCLVIDADRTLAPVDTGHLIGANLGIDKEIRAKFVADGYHADTFSAVSELWSTAPTSSYLHAIHQVSLEIALHHAWQQVFDALAQHAPILIATAGIPQVWRAVLDRHGHTGLPAIGGCHSGLDKFFVDPEAKADVVRMLKKANWRVMAAGDSLVDLPMMQIADVALFVPDFKGSPALHAQLHTITNVRHFQVNGQVVEQYPRWQAEDVIAHCRKDLRC